MHIISIIVFEQRIVWVGTLRTSCIKSYRNTNIDTMNKLNNTVISNTKITIVIFVEGFERT